jgi:hypothetical protein
MLVIRAFAIHGLFQYNEQHQYPFRSHGRCCRADPISCTRSFIASPHHFNSMGYKLRPLMVDHSENPQEFIRFPFNAFSIHAVTQAPRITRVTCNPKSFNIKANASVVFAIFGLSLTSQFNTKFPKFRERRWKF